MKTKYIYINTIGCQMNVYDSGRIAGLMAANGYRQTDTLEAANLVLVNTCAIREKAEQKAFSFLGRLAAMKRKDPSLIIAAGGCVAQQEGERIFKRSPYVDLVFGPHAIPRLPELVASVENRRCRVIDIAMDDESGDSVNHISGYEIPEPDRQSSAISRFVTIMQGCDNYCTYCVVPYVRGREASRRPEDILREVRGLVERGVREVTLLGQNVNSYGIKEGLCSFASLLGRINDLDGLERIRFTTSHPKDLSAELTAAFAQLPKLCPHIHLPVQSGSDTILKRMNRKYTVSDYLEKVDRLREARPDIAISSDMIVGFPGETDADFRMTLDLMDRVAFDSLFAFIYSDRPNAPARKFGDKVPEAVKQERINILLKRQSEHTLKKHQSLIGTRQLVLVEGMSKRHAGAQDAASEAPGLRQSGGQYSQYSQWSGRTGGNKIVNFSMRRPDVSAETTQAETPVIGGMTTVVIREAFFHSLRGDAAVDEHFSQKGSI